MHTDCQVLFLALDTHLSCTTNPQGKYDSYPHFTGKETEAKEADSFVQDHTARPEFDPDTQTSKMGALTSTPYFFLDWASPLTLATLK